MAIVQDEVVVRHAAGGQRVLHLAIDRVRRNRCDAGQRDQETCPALQPRFVPEHIQSSFTVSRKISRRPTGTTSTDNAWQSRARSMTITEFEDTKRLIATPRVRMLSTPGIRNRLSVGTAGNATSMRRQNCRRWSNEECTRRLPF